MISEEVRGCETNKHYISLDNHQAAKNVDTIPK